MRTHNLPVFMAEIAGSTGQGSTVAVSPRTSKAKAKPAVKSPDLAEGMTNMNVIIKDKDKLASFATRAIGMYQTSRAMMHVAIVSAVWHATQHGNPVLFQRIFDALGDNDKTAVRLFLRRTSAIVGLGGENPDYDAEGNERKLDADVINAAVSQGQYLALKQGTFSVIAVGGHTSDVAKAWAKLMSERFIKPDGKMDHLILERDNFAAIRSLADTDALKQFINTAKRIEAPGKNVKSTVSEAVKKLAQGFREKAEVMLGQTTLDQG